MYPGPGVRVGVSQNGSCFSYDEDTTRLSSASKSLNRCRTSRCARAIYWIPEGSSPLDSNSKRAWSFGLLSCCGVCGACKYPESLRRYPLTDFQAASAVHAGVPVFYTRKIGGALIVSTHKASTRILFTMKLSLQTVSSMLSLKSLAIWVGSYRWGFLFHPLWIPIIPTSFFIHPTERSDEHFSRRLALARTFMNDMASEAVVLVTLAQQPVALDAIYVTVFPSYLYVLWLCVLDSWNIVYIMSCHGPNHTRAMFLYAVFTP